jgi:hypothetical protein
VSCTVIDIDPNTTPVAVTIERPIGAGIGDPVNSILSIGDFGITSLGVAYFDSGGATPGDVAALGWDGSRDSLFLESGAAATDPHLMGLAGPARREPLRVVVRPHEIEGRLARARARRLAADASRQHGTQEKAR